MTSDSHQPLLQTSVLENALLDHQLAFPVRSKLRKFKTETILEE